MVSSPLILTPLIPSLFERGETQGDCRSPSPEGRGGQGVRTPSAGSGGEVYAIFPIGNFLIRLPVPAKIALQTAGAIGGVPGSPTRPCASVLGTIWTSTTGISARRSI